jgi:PAS domain S-box-containing protein
VFGIAAEECSKTGDGRMSLKTHAWRWALAVGLFAAVLQLALRGSDVATAVLHLAVQVLAVACVVAGLRMYRPAGRTAWYLLLTGMLVYLAANAIWYPANARGVPPPFPSLADALYISAYLLLLGGATLIVRAGAGGRDRGAFLDVLALTAGVGALVWVVLMEPYVDDASLSSLAKVVAVSYPLLDLLFLAVVARISLLPGRKPVALWLLGGFLLTQLGADSLYGGRQLAGTYSFGSEVDALWLASFALFAAAALHPSMRTLASPARGPAPGVVWRTAAMIVAALLGFVAIIIHGLGGNVPVLLVIVAATPLSVFARMHLLSVDIETHRRTQEELRESRERFRRLSDATFEGIVMVSDGRIVDVNRAFIRMFGLENEQVVGLAPDDLIAPESLPTIYEHLALGSEEPWELEVVLRNGRRMWNESRAITIPYGGSEARIISIRDITERRAAEQQLAELNVELERKVLERTADLEGARAFLDGVIAASPAAIFRVRAQDYSTTYVSASVERLLGYRPEEIVGVAGWLPEHTHPDDLDAVSADAQRAIEEGRTESETVHRLRCKDGTYRWFLFAMHREFDRAGNPIEVITAALDITDRKQAEEDLQQAKEEAERANKAKSEFLSRASHELRTPLNAILGFGQLLDMSAASPDDRDSLEQIIKAGRHLLGMVEELLDISRIDASELSLSIESVAIDDVVHETMDLVLPRSLERAIQLHSGILQPPLHVMADRQRLKQVLLNLLSNAISYSCEGGHVTVSSERIGDEKVALRVTDTGPGIAPDRIDLLFSPFERLGAETTDERGIGLGLALTKSLVKAMGGTIGVESEVGVGSTFSVELQVAAAPPLVEREYPSTGAVGTLAPGSTVMCIEDNFDSMHLVQRILSRRPGIKLIAVMQGRLGVELAREHHPDLVLLDLHLPDIPGEQVLETLKNQPDTADIPVIVISAAGEERRVKKLLSAGAKDYLAKPVDVDRLLQALDAILGSFTASGKR